MRYVPEKSLSRHIKQDCKLDMSHSVLCAKRFLNIFVVITEKPIVKLTTIMAIKSAKLVMPLFDV
jgi:hypothetical protein